MMRRAASLALPLMALASATFAAEPPLSGLLGIGPWTETVATPTLDLDIACAPPRAPCRAIAVAIAGLDLARGGERLRRTLDLSAWAGRRMRLTVAGTGADGEALYTWRFVVIETGPALRRVLRAPGRVLAFDGARAVFARYRALGLASVEGKVADLPALPAQLWPERAWLDGERVILSARGRTVRHRARLAWSAPATGWTTDATNPGDDTDWRWQARTDANGDRRLWRRAAGGDWRRISGFATGDESHPVLAADGSLAFQHGGRLYLAPPEAAPRDIASARFRAIPAARGWHLVYGDSVFAVD